jgi:hypothetical protein
VNDSPLRKQRLVDPLVDAPRPPNGSQFRRPRRQRYHGFL